MKSALRRPLIAALFTAILFGRFGAVRAADPLPVPWNGMDIGAPAPAGAAKASGAGAFALTAGGTGLAGPGDEFHFVFQSATGDFALVARLTVPGGAGLAGQAGLMARNALSTNSDFVALADQGGATVQTRYRPAYALGTVASETPGAAFSTRSVWLRLVKRGERVEGYAAADQNNAPAGWQRLGSGQVLGTGMVYVGLWLAGGSATAPVAFDHVALSLGNQPLVDNGTYAIVPADALGMRLAASGSGVALAAPAAGPAQTWRLTDTGGGVYSILTTDAPARALSVVGGGSKEGTLLTLLPDKGDPAQRWSLVSNANDTLSLVPRCAPGDELDDFGGDATPAARIDLWPRADGDPHLQWNLVPAP